MKRLLIFLLLFMAILLSGCSYINDAKNKTLKVGIGVKDKVMSFKESMQAYWACMDGCLFMQKIHEKKYGLNMTKKDHDICATMCWERYGEGLMPMASTVAAFIIKVFAISFMAIAAIATLQQESGIFLMGMACGVWIHRLFDWLDEKIWRESND